MFKGLCICYAIILVTFFSVAISGYWAFGIKAEGVILSNFSHDGRALLPKWFILITNIFTILQQSAVAVVNKLIIHTHTHKKRKNLQQRRGKLNYQKKNNAFACARSTCSQLMKCWKEHLQIQRAISSQSEM